MEIFKDNCFLSVGLKEVTFFHIVRLPKGVNESLGGACGLSVVVGVGGDRLIRCSSSNGCHCRQLHFKARNKLSRSSACLHTRKVRLLAVSCIFPLSMLCVMLNSGVTANLVLAVLFIAVQARSIQNQGKLNCFSADFSLG